MPSVLYGALLAGGFAGRLALALAVHVVVALPNPARTRDRRAERMAPPPDSA
jgi:hypothetical protein